MAKIGTIILDDEAAGSKALSAALTKYCPGISILGIYESPEEGLKAIRELKPELLFLDVQMPQMSGFDVLQRASPITFEVIFVSAHEHYAIKAIKFSALDYLLKPLDVDELIHAVNKAKERLALTGTAYQYQSVLNNIQLKSGRLEKLAVPSAEGIELYDTKDIIYCQADGSYTKIVLKNNQQALVCKNLKEFENMLSGSGFCRIHHSYIINIMHVHKYIKGEGGSVILTDKHQVDVSRRKKEEFLALLNNVQ